ncbi:fibronectin type III domain-containing protein [Arthrobacter sp. MMS18-M83]|uniref:fibronectin type III domain-containing protein n=1 Tax=Arthrobacter sp. MMS18-M83 TaxID=2996261 RepID=UPI00227BB0D2|nr:hypothetical protein [Arthrobacter sp. MMS18-M83]WAH97321.1 hypothetical protein OW521_23790 [Arthrobacter sp. MMS18-M83]
MNEDVRTWWVANSSDPGEWLQLDLNGPREMRAIQINLADNELALLAPQCADGAENERGFRGIYRGPNTTEFRVEVSLDGTEWTLIHDTQGTGADTPHSFVVLEQAQMVRFVKVTGYRMPFDAPFAVSGIRVFGITDGARPKGTAPTVTRTGDRSVRIAWQADAGADGYNIRYGTAPEKLYQSWLVYDQTELELKALNAETDYWVAVDAFNKSGITPEQVQQM